METGDAVPLSQTTITVARSLGDLRRVVPVRVASDHPYASTNTGRFMAVQTRENDPAVLFYTSACELPLTLDVRIQARAVNLSGLHALCHDSRRDGG